METRGQDKNLEKAGGISAGVAAATVVVGLGMFAFLLSDYTTGDPTPAESVAFLADNYAAMYIWNLITLIAYSILLVVVHWPFTGGWRLVGAPWHKRPPQSG